MHHFVRLCILNSFLFFPNYLVNALLEVVNKSFTQLSLLVLCHLIFQQFTFNFILQLFPLYLRLHVLNQIKPSQQILLEVSLDLVREHLGSIFTLVKRIFNELTELLIIMLRVMDWAWTFAYSETTHNLVHVLWFDASLGFCFLHVLFFKIGVRLVELVCVVVVVAVTNLVGC